MMLQASARAKFLRGSARKMRQVVDLVRGQKVDVALSMLEVLPKSAAGPVRKTVQSAAANALAAEGTAHLKTEDLRICKITVDGGPMMKRIRPMGMGRAYRINKRLCHLTVIIEGEPHEAGVHGGGKKITASSGTSRSATTSAPRRAQGRSRKGAAPGSPGGKGPASRSRVKKSAARKKDT